MTSLGNREEGGGDDPSQETCPNVESQTCGPRVYVLTNVFFKPHHARWGKHWGRSGRRNAVVFLQCFARNKFIERGNVK